MCYHLFGVAGEACTAIPLLPTKAPMIRMFYFGASYLSELFLFKASSPKYAKNVRVTRHDQLLLPQHYEPEDEIMLLLLLLQV